MMIMPKLIFYSFFIIIAIWGTYEVYYKGKGNHKQGNKPSIDKA